MKRLVTVSVTLVVAVVVFLSVRNRREQSVGPESGKNNVTDVKAPRANATKNVPLKASRPQGTDADSRIGESNAPLASSTVRILKQKLGDGISDHELRVLDAAYSTMVTQREAIELSLAKREIVETNVVLISIPEYYAQGLQLYSNFSDRIAEQLGADRTKELMKDIDAVVRANNASFGDQKQEILVHDLGDSVEILHGSGALMRINGQISTVKVTSKSQLLKNNLLKYQYLKPLFPNNSVDEPQ